MKKILFLICLICPFLLAQDINQNIREEKSKVGDLEITTVKKYYDKECTKLYSSMSYYLNNKEVVLHGSSKIFTEKGNVVIEQNFSRGIKHGKELVFKPDTTKPEIEIDWDFGKKQKELAYDSNGRTLLESDFQDNIRKDIQQSYFSNNKLSHQCHYINKKKNGLETAWYDNGQKRYELTWKNDNKDGTESYWYKDGTLQSMTFWVEGKPDGEMLYHFENGAKKDQLFWDHGVIIKERTSWTAKGEVIAKCTYKDGQPFSGVIFNTEDPKMLELRYYENGRLTKTEVCTENGQVIK